jgi:predicted nucleic acid-binding protein
VNGSLVYLDSSALVKLVIDEPETLALREFLGAYPDRLSSVVGSVETLRIARRVGGSDALDRAQALLEAIELVRLSDSTQTAAARLEPIELRSLDAIHLATALSLTPDLAGMVVYDRRLADAARAAGLTVWAPS